MRDATDGMHEYEYDNIIAQAAANPEYRVDEIRAEPLISDTDISSTLRGSVGGWATETPILWAIIGEVCTRQYDAS